ncbi:hypothetical protein DPMN_003572 [Dreissena polymorpha]|uniref:Uncharacterized protein n=1 Tax=Dreissena polymorpha TaxID=45954 RepID=A0A9D4MNN5_DREPO|nr:hypothetical protein DPMN_003572 [Dreissena polymorpha]
MLECLQTKCGRTNPKISPEQSAIFQLVREINKTNVMTKFHDDKAKNVTSIIYKCSITRKTAPPPLARFHDDWAKNVTSRVFKSHVIQLTGTIFKVNSHINETNVLTKFHENWVKNVTSRVFTCFHYIHIEKNAPPTRAPDNFFSRGTIFELVRDINKTNVLTNFHDDWKTALPTGGHVFQRTGTTFKLNQHIIKTNILTNFELNRDFIGKKLLTKFHEDQTKKYDGQRPDTKAHLSN